MPRRNPVQGTAKLWLTIAVKNARGKEVAKLYDLQFLDSHPDLGQPAWRLRKSNGVFYDVIFLPMGPECTCEDFVWCREHKDPKGCKHCCALRAVRLLP